MVVVSAIEDAITTYLLTLKQNAMGLYGLWEAPSAAQRAMTLFAQSRSMALSVAVVLAAMLFKISPYGLSGIAQKAEGDVEADGQKMGEKFALNENAGMAFNDMAVGNAHLNAVEHYGMNNTTSAAQFDSMSQIEQANANLNGLSSDSSIASAAQVSGQSSANSSIGEGRANEIHLYVNFSHHMCTPIS